jgi:hypothetical protein
MSSDLLIMLFIGTRFCNLLVDAMMIHLQPRLDQQVYGRRPVLLGYYRVVCSVRGVDSLISVLLTPYLFLISGEHTQVHGRGSQSIKRKGRHVGQV